MQSSQAPAIPAAPIDHAFQDMGAAYWQFAFAAQNLRPAPNTLASNLDLFNIATMRHTFKLLIAMNHPDVNSIQKLYLVSMNVWLTDVALCMLRQPDVAQVPDVTLEYIVDVCREMLAWNDDKKCYLQWSQMLHVITCRYVVRPTIEDNQKLLACIKLTLDFYDAAISFDQLDMGTMLNYGIGLSYWLHASAILQDRQEHIAALDKTLSLMDKIAAKGLIIEIENRNEFLSYWLIKMMLDTTYRFKFTAEEFKSTMQDRVKQILLKCKTLHPTFYKQHYKASCIKYPVLRSVKSTLKTVLEAISTERKSVPLTLEFLDSVEQLDAAARNKAQPAKVVAPAVNSTPAAPSSTPLRIAPQTPGQKLFSLLLLCGQVQRRGGFMITTATLYEKFFQTKPRIVNLPAQMYLSKDQFDLLQAKPHNMKAVLGQMIENNFKPKATPKPKNKKATPSRFDFEPVANQRDDSKAETKVAMPDVIPMSGTLTRATSAQMPAPSPISKTSPAPSTAPNSPLEKTLSHRRPLSLFAKPGFTALGVKVSNSFSELASEDEEDLVVIAESKSATDSKAEEVTVDERKVEEFKTEDLKIADSKTEDSKPEVSKHEVAQVTVELAEKNSPAAEALPAPAPLAETFAMLELSQSNPPAQAVSPAEKVVTPEEKQIVPAEKLEIPELELDFDEILAEFHSTDQSHVSTGPAESDLPDVLMSRMLFPQCYRAGIFHHRPPAPHTGAPIENAVTQLANR